MTETKQEEVQEEYLAGVVIYLLMTDRIREAAEFIKRNNLYHIKREYLN